MATLKPFAALRPNPDQLYPLQFLGEEVGVGMELDYLKYRLTPSGKSIEECQDFLNSILTQKSYYKEELPSFYVYQATTDSNSYTGVWALTDVSDAVIEHEETLNELVEQLTDYREKLGLDGKGILLTYVPTPKIEELIAHVKKNYQGYTYACEGVKHTIWRVNEELMINAFKQAFTEIGTVYMADGHHRWAAAKRLSQPVPHYISSVYVASDNLAIKAFHKVIKQNVGLRISNAMEILGRYYYISLIPYQKPYRPDKKQRLGMCLSGTWYQLDLREGVNSDELTDTSFLQQHVLGPAFGIYTPRTDDRLKSYADTQWSQLLLEVNRNQSLIVFTLYPVTTNEFLNMADSGWVLPPKSTYILPKIPYGLLMHINGY